MNTSRESIGGAGGAASGSAGHLHSFLNNSLAIRQEIQRFESVHPSIYAIYDLIDLIQDNQIAQQIRDHVVCIEGELPSIGIRGESEVEFVIGENSFELPHVQIPSTYSVVYLFKVTMMCIWEHPLGI